MRQSQFSAHSRDLTGRSYDLPKNVNTNTERPREYESRVQSFDTQKSTDMYGKYDQRHFEI